MQIKVSEDPPWALEYEGINGGIRRIEASDLFEALREMRKELEDAGYLLLCAGSRPDVNPSGMSRGMGGGRKAYVMRCGRPGNFSEMIDIFDYAEPATVGTIQQQEQYLQAWIESLRRPQ
jgi:hypothetical protein